MIEFLTGDAFITYCIFCWIVSSSMVMSSKSSNIWKKISFFIFAPYVVPVAIGIKIME